MMKNDEPRSGCCERVGYTDFNSIPPFYQIQYDNIGIGT
jgi:hypothetical protein